MVLPAELCEKHGRGSGIKWALMFMPNYSHVALTSAQSNGVRCWHNFLPEMISLFMGYYLNKYSNLKQKLNLSGEYFRQLTFHAIR